MHSLSPPWRKSAVSAQHNSTFPHTHKYFHLSPFDDRFRKSLWTVDWWAFALISFRKKKESREIEIKNFGANPIISTSFAELYIIFLFLFLGLFFCLKGSSLTWEGLSDYSLPFEVTPLVFSSLSSWYILHNALTIYHWPTFMVYYFISFSLFEISL